VKPARLDGQRHELDTAASHPHRWTPGGRLEITVGDRTIEAIVLKAGAGRYEVWIAGERHLVEEERRGAGSPNAAEDDVLVAPMPAKVVRIAVRAGDEVTDGQTLVVLESMKMELGVTAPRAGRVQKVGAEVKVGAIVPAGTLLVELEPATMTT
jgi:biotin carboxyl carrier protein